MIIFGGKLEYICCLLIKVFLLFCTSTVSFISILLVILWAGLALFSMLYATPCARFAILSPCEVVETLRSCTCIELQVMNKQNE